MPSVAVDIGTYTLKMVHAKPGKKPHVLRTVELFNSLGMSIPSDDSSIEKFSQLIASVFTDHKLPRNEVRLALPEQVVSTKVIAIPPLSDAELASAIGWQAEQHIPIPLDELSLEYQVLYRPNKGEKKQKMKVLLVGVRKMIIERYVDAFIEAGIEPVLLESQMISLIRSLQFTQNDPTTMVISIGAASMDISIISQGQIAFVFSHLNGGQLLTRTIEQTIGLEAKQAEQYKRAYGLDETQFEGKIRKALLPSIQIFINEIQKAKQFYVNQAPQDPVQRILLSGGTSQLPGLVQYVTAQVGMEVLVASPFATATGEIPQVNHPVFGTCMGLLMRDL